MWKKLGKFLFALVAILGSAAAIFTLYKKRKENAYYEDEFSDIFEDEDMDLDETL